MMSLLLTAMKARRVALYTSVMCFMTAPVIAREKAPTKREAAIDEKDNAAQPDFLEDTTLLPVQKAPKRRSYFTVGLGSRFVLAAAQGLSDMRQSATENILRPNEVIYKGSGVALEQHSGAFSFEPTLRAEWEIPGEQYSWLGWFRQFSILWSFEAGYSPSREVLSAAGNFATRMHRRPT